MRFWGSGALRYVKSEERTPLERVTANKWGSQFALSAISCQPLLFFVAVICSLHQHEADTRTT
jgi:hypothetical protein